MWFSLTFLSSSLLFHFSCAVSASNHTDPEEHLCKSTKVKAGSSQMRPVVTLSGAIHTCRDLEPVDTPVYPICFCAGIVQAFACLSTWRLTARYRADGPLINVGEFVFPSLRKPCEQIYSRRNCFLFSMRSNHSHISILWHACTNFITHTRAGDIPQK